MATALQSALGSGRVSQRAPDLWPYSFLFLVVATSILILAPLFVVFWLSFHAEGAIDAPIAYTLDNYINVFGDVTTYQVMLNTFGFSLVTLIVALGFGVPIAWLVERTDLPSKTVIFTLMAIGLLLPGFAAAMGWLFVAHPRIGLANVWLRQVFGLAEAPFNITSIIGMGWVQGLNMAPVAFIMTAAVFRAIDPALEEAAGTSGCGFRRTLMRVTLPLAWPGIMAAAIYILTIGFAAFDVPAIIGWSSRTFTFSTYLVLQLQPNNGVPKYEVAAALSAFVVVLAAVLSWWYARMQKQTHRYQVVTGKNYRPRTLRLGRWKYLVWTGVLSYFALAKLIPVLLIIWASLLPFFQLPSAAAWKVASLRRYFDLPWPLLSEGIGHTLALMVLVPTATLIISVAFSWVVLRSRIRYRALFDMIAFLPHAVPNMVFGVGILFIAIYVFEAFVPAFGTFWILLMAFTIARVSYGTRMTNSGFMQLHKELEESAQASGAKALSVLRKIVMPLIAPTLLYAWLWMALLTSRELTLAVLLTSRNNITLPVIIWDLWVGGGLGNASAVAVLTLLVMTPFIVLYWLIARKRGVAMGA